MRSGSAVRTKIKGETQEFFAEISGGGVREFFPQAGSHQQHAALLTLDRNSALGFATRTFCCVSRVPGLGW